MLVKVWEVYKHNSLECVVFKTEKLAENQTVMDDVEFIAPANVDLSQNEVDKLNENEPVWI